METPLVLLVLLIAAASETLKVKPGEDVTLKCQSPRDESIRVIKWKGPAQKSDGYVFFFRDNKSQESYQHPSFRGRVELRDPEMKNGDFSVILKNVTVNDTGTYECFVGTGSSGQAEFRQSVTLTVTESGHTAGNTEETRDKEGGDKEGGQRERRSLMAPLLTVAVVIGGVGLVGGFVLRKRQRSQQQNQDPPATELQTLSPS